MTKFVKLLLIALFSTMVYVLNNTFSIPDWYGQVRENIWTLTFTQVNMAEIALYALSGIAFWLLWKDRKLGDITWPAWSYAGILIFSSFWSLLFFGQEIPMLALLDMVALTIMTGFAAFQFYRYEKLAGYLIIPCLAGALFFTFHNFQLYRGFLEVMQA